MISKQPLSGRTILNTRPHHQAQPLTHLIEQLGGNVELLPCIDIKHYPAEIITTTIKDLSILDHVIFVSANAVHATMPHITFNPQTQLIAIGPGTAAALKHYHQTANAMPPSASSEGLLAMPELQAIQAHNVAICCGDNSKPDLKKILEQRQANVQIITCYQRTIPLIQQQTIETLLCKKIDVIISTSTESLQNLVQLLSKDTAGWLYQQQLLVVTPAMSSIAQQAGWIQSPWVADQATDQSIITTLVTHLNEGI